MKTRNLIVAVVVAAVAAGCSASTKHLPNKGESQIFQSAAAPAPVRPYVLQPGDQLSIRFYRNPELDQDVVVRPDGMISLPFVDEVQASGRSPQELDQELTRRYTGELATPDVSVIVQQFAGHKVFVGGEVGRQGVLPMSGTLTLYQAVQEAGGFLPSAHRGTVLVVRRDLGGEVVSRTIDLQDLEQGAMLERDIFLAPYDVVWVPRSRIADANLYVKQYVRDLLPTVPGFSIDTGN